MMSRGKLYARGALKWAPRVMMAVLLVAVIFYAYKVGHINLVPTKNVLWTH
jgi:hypothetical protein